MEKTSADVVREHLEGRLGRATGRVGSVAAVLDTIFDIETGPLPWDQLSESFEPPAGPGDFDPSAVKLGQMTDLDKINAKVSQARAAHEKTVAGHAAKAEAARAEYINRAALDATTGQVLAIGLHPVDAEPLILADDSETFTLSEFWAEMQKVSERHGRAIGFNIFGFDLPFLVRRSWAQGVVVPCGIFHKRYWADYFLDLAEVYRLGVRGGYIKLDRLAAFLGCERKSGDGAHFSELWKTDREAAIEYLKQDLVVTEQVATRLGVI